MIAVEAVAKYKKEMKTELGLLNKTVVKAVTVGLILARFDSQDAGNVLSAVAGLTGAAGFAAPMLFAVSGGLGIFNLYSKYTRDDVVKEVQSTIETLQKSNEWLYHHEVQNRESFAEIKKRGEVIESGSKTLLTAIEQMERRIAQSRKNAEIFSERFASLSGRCQALLSQSQEITDRTRLSGERALASISFFKGLLRECENLDQRSLQKRFEKESVEGINERMKKFEAESEIVRRCLLEMNANTLRVLSFVTELQALQNELVSLQVQFMEEEERGRQSLEKILRDQREIVIVQMGEASQIAQAAARREASCREAINVISENRSILQTLCEKVNQVYRNACFILALSAGVRLWVAGIRKITSLLITVGLLGITLLRFSQIKPLRLAR